MRTTIKEKNQILDLKAKIRMKINLMVELQRVDLMITLDQRIHHLVEEKLMEEIHRNLKEVDDQKK